MIGMAGREGSNLLCPWRQTESAEASPLVMCIAWATALRGRERHCMPRHEPQNYSLFIGAF